jgi:hypothetical protein
MDWKQKEKGVLAVKRSHLSGGVLAVAALVAAMVASAAYGIATATGPLSFRSCVSQGGGAPCTAISTLDSPRGLSMSDDNTRVFVAENASNSVSIIQRVRGAGNLVTFNPSPCVSEAGTAPCVQGHGLTGAIATAAIVSNAYVVSTTPGAVAVLKKASGGSGRWEYNSCISQGGNDGCTVGHGLAGATSILGSPDRKFVYVGGPGSIAVLKRNPTKGTLTQDAGLPGCVSQGGADNCKNVDYLPDTVRDMAISSNGAFLYAAASTPGSGAVVVFSRDKATGALTKIACVNSGATNGCAGANALVRPMGVTIDASGGGGKSVYVAANGSNAVAVFARNVTTGALTQLGGTSGCVSEGGAGGCTPAIGLTAPTAVRVYKTGVPVYVLTSDGVASFQRSKATFVLTQYPGTGGCINAGSTDGCLGAGSLAGATGLAFAIKTIYVTGVTGDTITQLHIQ